MLSAPADAASPVHPGCSTDHPWLADWGGAGSFLQLQALALHNNQLNGALPATWGGNLNNVTTLDISNNFITGTVPACAP